MYRYVWWRKHLNHESVNNEIVNSGYVTVTERLNNISDLSLPQLYFSAAQFRVKVGAWSGAEKGPKKREPEPNFVKF
jgi:hypothetical protein